jgi:hypothetical protein
VAAQPQAKSQVDVLEVAEEPLVEPADFLERRAAVQRGRRARRENVGLSRGPLLVVSKMRNAPRTAGDVVAVASTVEIVGGIRQTYLTRERCHVWMR